MSISVTKFKTKLQGKMHGRTLNKVADVYGKMNEAGANVLARVDPYETIRRVRIENAIFDKVYNYTAPSDLKGSDKIIDIRPIGERAAGDVVRGSYARQFDILKENDTATIEYLNGVKTLRLAKDLTDRTILHRCDSLSLEGTVVATGDVSNLNRNTVEYISGDASIGFTLTGTTGTGTITFSLTNAVDLDDMEDVGSLFAWLRFSDASRISSVKFRWGDDDSNYWETTVTAPHDRSAFEDSAFNLARFDWTGASQTGSPDAEAVAYLYVEFTTTTGVSMANNFIENITAAKGEAYELVYYSNAIFTDSTGVTYKVEPTDDSDLVILENTTINLFLYESIQTFAGEVKGKNFGADVQFAELKLEGNQKKPGLYDLYNMENPSLALVQQQVYHEFENLNE